MRRCRLGSAWHGRSHTKGPYTRFPGGRRVDSVQGAGPPGDSALDRGAGFTPRQGNRGCGPRTVTQRRFTSSPMKKAVVWAAFTRRKSRPRRWGVWFVRHADYRATHGLSPASGCRKGCGFPAGVEQGSRTPLSGLGSRHIHRIMLVRHLRVTASRTATEGMPSVEEDQ